MNKYRAHHEAFWGLVAQGGGFGAGLLILLVIIEKANALSFGLGFLVCLLPNFVFYILYFRYQGAQHLHAIKNRFYVGEMVKLFLTAGMFGFIWQLSWIEPMWVFCGYGASQLCFFLPPIGMSFMQRDNQAR